MPIPILGRALHQVSIQAKLPLAQETLTRTIEAFDGENVIHINSTLEGEDSGEGER